MIEQGSRHLLAVKKITLDTGLVISVDFFVEIYIAWADEIEVRYQIVTPVEMMSNVTYVVSRKKFLKRMVMEEPL